MRELVTRKPTNTHAHTHTPYKVPARGRSWVLKNPAGVVASGKWLNKAVPVSCILQVRENKSSSKTKTKEKKPPPAQATAQAKHRRAENELIAKFYFHLSNPSVTRPLRRRLTPLHMENPFLGAIYLELVLGVGKGFGVHEIDGEYSYNARQRVPVHGQI